MTPEEREQQFADHPPPEIRERILAKVHEYEALDPNERELRLRATELRWYLMPLLRESPTNRAARLAQVPDDLRDLVKTRLDQWSILPPPLQQEFLENERALRYFAQVDSTNSPPATGTHSAIPIGALEGAVRRRTQTITAGSTSFLNSRRMKNRKRSTPCPTPNGSKWKKPCRRLTNCRRRKAPSASAAFAKFASMNAAEEQEFLKNAERWSQMSPHERQTWRDLVANVPNGRRCRPRRMPPMPPRRAPQLRIQQWPPITIEDGEFQFPISAAAALTFPCASDCVSTRLAHRSTGMA